MSKEILSRLERIDHKEYSCGFEFADSSTFDETARCFEERKILAKEIERLNKELQDTKEHLGEYLHEQEEENKRLNNIINELEKWVEYQATHTMQQHNYYGVLDKIKELKGSDKE